MSRIRKSHKDVEFAVEGNYYKRFEDACVDAISKAASHGSSVNIDVLAYSKAGAKWWNGDYGVDIYNQDPDASIHERIVIHAESIGRIA